MKDLFSSEAAPLKCPFCDKSFRSPTYLRGHWRRRHGSEIGYDVFHPLTTDEKEKFIQENIRRRPKLFITPLLKVSSFENPKFKLNQNVFKFAFNEIGLETAKLGYGSELITSVFTYLVKEIKKKSKEKSYIGLSLDADCLDSPLLIGFTQAKDFSVDQLLHAIFALGTSDKHIELDSSLTMKVDTLNLEPPGHMTFGGKAPLSRLEAVARRNFVYGWASVCAPFDCALVAFVLSQLKREYGSQYQRKTEFTRIKLTNFGLSLSELQKRETLTRPSQKLFTAVAVLKAHFSDKYSFQRALGRDFLERLQRHMENCIDAPQQLVVYKDEEWDAPIFSGETLRPVEDRVYFLYLANSHICFLAEPEKFFAATLWDCCLTISKSEYHDCPSKERFCHKCATRKCWDSTESNVICPLCQTHFNREECYNLHARGSPSRCETHATCLKCMALKRRQDWGSSQLVKHRCLEYRCKYCNENFKADDEEAHLCVSQPPRASRLGGKEEFFRVYYDMETCVRGPDNRLVPYLVSAIFVCSFCEQDIENPKSWLTRYDCCGQRKRLYWFQDGLQSFLRDVFGGARKDLKRGVCLAYNMRYSLNSFLSRFIWSLCRNFDGYFLLSQLLDAKAPVKKVVIAGNRLMTISFNGVQVKDFNLFCQVCIQSLGFSFFQSSF